MDEHDDTTLISEQEAATLCGYTLRSFRDLRYRGAGPPYIQAMKGALVKYRRSAVHQWIEDHTTEPEQEAQ